MIYFEPDGACWDDFTCWTAQTAYHLSGYDSATSANPNETYLNFSLFDRTQTNNPMKNMSFVYVPYCTGDLHEGEGFATNRWASLEVVSIQQPPRSKVTGKYVARLLPSMNSNETPACPSPSPSRNTPSWCETSSVGSDGRSHTGI